MAHQNMNLLISNVQALTKAYIDFNDHQGVSDQFLINFIHTGQDLKKQTDQIIAQIARVHQNRKLKQHNDSKYRTINFDQEVRTPRAVNSSKLAEASHLQVEKEHLDQKRRKSLKQLKAKLTAIRARNQNQYR